MITVSDAIRRTREALGLSQEALADAPVEREPELREDRTPLPF